MLEAIATQILRHAPAEGMIATAMPGLTLLRASSTALVQRGVLRPSFCVVAQGEKIAQAGADNTLRYGAGSFVLWTTPRTLRGGLRGCDPAGRGIGHPLLHPQEVALHLQR